MYKEQAANTPSGRMTPTFTSQSPSPFSAGFTSGMPQIELTLPVQDSDASTHTDAHAPTQAPPSPRTLTLTKERELGGSSPIRFRHRRSMNSEEGKKNAAAKLGHIDTLKAEKQRLLALLTDHLERESYTVADWSIPEDEEGVGGDAKSSSSSPPAAAAEEGEEGPARQMTQEERDLLEFQREEQRISEMLSALGKIGSTPAAASSFKPARASSPLLLRNNGRLPSPSVIKPSPSPVVLSGRGRSSPSPNRAIKLKFAAATPSPSSVLTSSSRPGLSARSSPTPTTPLWFQQSRAREALPVVTPTPRKAATTQSERDSQIAAFREEEARLLAMYSSPTQSQAPSPASFRQS
jgi:hypothetical protein